MEKKKGSVSMKKFLGKIFLILLFSLAFCNLVIADDLSKEQIEEKVTKQKVLKSSILEILQEMEVSEGELNSFGDYYFDDNQNPVFLIKSKIPNNENKLVKLQEKLQKKVLKNFNTKPVEYSYNELESAHIQILARIETESLLEPSEYSLSVNTMDNRVNLTLKSLDPSLKKELTKDFKNILTINEDPTFHRNIISTSLADRKRTWNKLGAGIGISTNSGGDCTSGGIAHKNGQYFVLTAAHCLNSATMWQYRDYSVGRVHLNSGPSGYDAGLIAIQSSSLQRYVTNGLLVSGIKNYDYDSKLTSSMLPRMGDIVCLEGITSGHKCARISLPRDSYSIESFSNALVGVQVTSFDGTSAAQRGDSGGPWHYATNTGQSLVGIQSAREIGTSRGWFVPWVEYRDKYLLNLYTSDTNRAM